MAATWPALLLRLLLLLLLLLLLERLYLSQQQRQKGHKPQPLMPYSVCVPVGPAAAVSYGRSAAVLLLCVSWRSGSCNAGWVSLCCTQQRLLFAAGEPEL
jgi:hypothetical protein